MNHRYTPYIAIIAAIAQVAMWTTATFRGPAEAGTRTAAFQCIGNAVPPLMARGVLQAVVR